jgi:phosphoribosylamine--glycine ligase
MNVLVIGSGGREHALCWKLAQSPMIGKLFCAPGNPGIARVADRVAVDAGDHDAVIAFCGRYGIGLVVIGPEQPLVEGLADSLRAAGIRAFGPSAAAARLEGSKGFTKDLCRAHAIPTAAYAHFDDPMAARAYVATQPLPIVIKADGLAAGKGVVIAETHGQAEAAIDTMFEGGFGAAGASVVIEEFLTGEEASLFALVDGTDVLVLGGAQDHKRVGDGDTGPNTGGMGAYSPAPVLTPEVEARAVREIIAPTARAMVEAGSPFSGVLYAGLMLTADGPKLIEYNARFGDPECQVLMTRLASDLLPALLATSEGRLGEIALDWRAEVALTVVMAAEGYPGTPRKGTEIRGIDAAEAAGAIVFHAGTRRDADGRLLADGGRVLAVTGVGESVTAAAAAAYAGVDRIDWPGGFCRRDIGWRAIEQEG